FLRALPVKVRRYAEPDDDKAPDRFQRLVAERTPDDPEIREDEYDRHERGAPQPVRPFQIRALQAQHDDRAGGERGKKRDEYADESKQRAEGAGENEQARPGRLQNDRAHRRAEARVHAREAMEEDAVARHRVIDSRPEHRDDVQRAEYGDRDERRDQCRGLAAEERRRGHFGDPERAFHLGHRHGVNINDVDDEVERDNDQVRRQKRARQRSFRLFYLAGDIDDRVPAGVRKDRRDEGGAKNSEVVDLRPIEERLEVRGVAAADENRQQDDADERADLDHGENVLRRRAL